MLEYIFFDEGIRDKFVSFLHERGVVCATSDEGGLVAAIPEDLDDDLSDAIDHQYEVLLQENATLLEGTEDGLEKNAAGVQVQLADGSRCMIRLDPDLVARMLTALSLEELRDTVQSIAEQVEHPDNRPLCQS